MAKKRLINKERFIRTSLLASIILGVCITALAVIYQIISIRTETQACYDTLLNASAEACSKIENNFRNDRASLRMLSKVISQEDDLSSNEVNNQLNIYAVNSYITNIAILTPENKIIQAHYTNDSIDTTLDYNTEIKKGEHISSLQESVFRDGKYVIRNYVPLRNANMSKGLLFTELDPTSLARAWRPEIYNGAASFCIVDRTTGDVLLSNTKETYQNIKEMQNAVLTEQITDGKTNYVALPETNSFAAFRPMEIEQWSILFIIDKNVVMQQMHDMQHYSLLFMGIGAAVFLLYMIWIIHSSIRMIHATREEANTDILTGLENRNNYEAYCKTLKQTDNLICVYIDANGLHEINNKKGHLAGDMMLKFIAETLKESFPDGHIYRIGGDEFVIFHDNSTSVSTTLQQAAYSITKNDYHISYGIATGAADIPVNDIIKQAETRMYQMKKEYYEQLGKPIRNELPDEE